MAGKSIFFGFLEGPTDYFRESGRNVLIELIDFPSGASLDQ